MKSFFKKIFSKKEEVIHEEGVLVFDNFNFKLLIIQELMYEQKMLKPSFDVYEYSQEVPIDFDATYTEVSPEVKQFFEELDIPKSLAPHIKSLYLDGGNEIYSQLMPYGDGEGDEFDISEVSDRELSQFTNLSEVDAEAVSYFSVAATDFLKAKGIVVKEYHA